MKKFALLLALCLLFQLAACAAPEPPDAPAEQGIAPAETSPPPEMPEKTEQPDIPEEPIPEPGPLPEPQPEEMSESVPGPAAYIYRGFQENAAAILDKDGNVLLPAEAPANLLCDSLTGQICGFFRQAEGEEEAEIYDLYGNLQFRRPVTGQRGVFGNLFWYGVAIYEKTLCSLEDGTVLMENLKTVEPLGDYLFVQSIFRNSPGMLLDGEGNVVKELDRGFAAKNIHQYRGRDYLEMEAPDGTRTLIDRNGDMCLPRFYDDVLFIDMDCAIVQNGEKYLAVRLDDGETVMETAYRIRELTPNAAILEQDGDFILTDYEEKPLADRVYEDLETVKNANGRTTMLLGKYTAEDGSMWVQFLNLDGTERFAMEYSYYGFNGPEVVEDKYLLCYTYPGESRDTTDRCFAVVDLETQTKRFLNPRYTHLARWGDMPPELFFLCYNNEDKTRMFYDLYNVRGELMIGGLENVTYRDGLINCTWGDEKGLLRLDGTWFYKAP